MLRSMLSFLKRKPDPLIAQMAVTLDRLTSAVSRPDVSSDDLKETPYPLLERLDSLENRFEELRGTCLRHLQSASQRLKLVEQKEEQIEDEGGVTPQLPNIQTESAEESDLEYASRLLRGQGVQPLL